MDMSYNSEKNKRVSDKLFKHMILSNEKKAFLLTSDSEPIPYAISRFLNMGFCITGTMQSCMCQILKLPLDIKYLLYDGYSDPTLLIVPLHPTDIDFNRGYMLVPGNKQLNFNITNPDDVDSDEQDEDLYD